MNTRVKIQDIMQRHSALIDQPYSFFQLYVTHLSVFSVASLSIFECSVKTRHSVNSGPSSTFASPSPSLVL